MLPLPARLMHDETAIGLHGPTLQDRLIAAHAGRRRHLQLLEHVGEPHLQRPIDDDAERAVRVMFPDERDRLREIAVGHRRHRDQELVRQEVAGHGSKSTADGG